MTRAPWLVTVSRNALLYLCLLQMAPNVGSGFFGFHPLICQESLSRIQIWFLVSLVSVFSPPPLFLEWPLRNAIESDAYTIPSPVKDLSLARIGAFESLDSNTNPVLQAHQINLPRFVRL